MGFRFLPTLHYFPSKLSAFRLLLAFLKIILFYFILLFLAALGLRCCLGSFFSGCGEWGLLFVAVRRLLIEVASLVVEHGL